MSRRRRQRNWKRTELLNILMETESHLPLRLCSIRDLTQNFFLLSFSLQDNRKGPHPQSKMNFLSLDDLQMWKSAIFLLVFVSLGKFVEQDETPALICFTIYLTRSLALVLEQKIYVLFLLSRIKETQRNTKKVSASPCSTSGRFRLVKKKRQKESRREGSRPRVENEDSWKIVRISKKAPLDSDWEMDLLTRMPNECGFLLLRKTREWKNEDKNYHISWDFPFPPPTHLPLISHRAACKVFRRQKMMERRNYLTQFLKTIHQDDGDEAKEDVTKTISESFLLPLQPLVEKLKSYKILCLEPGMRWGRRKPFLVSTQCDECESIFFIFIVFCLLLIGDYATWYGKPGKFFCQFVVSWCGSVLMMLGWSQEAVAGMNLKH